MNKSREAYRNAAKAYQCPKCGAEAGKPCRTSSGGDRISVHLERGQLGTPRPRRTAEERKAFLANISVIGDRETRDFVVYGIRDKATKRFGYVGQTGSFSKRIISHAITAYRGSRTRQSARWMHGIVTEGGAIEFVILQFCRDKEHSLDCETTWVQKLTAGGHTLTNKWRIHQEVILSNLPKE